VPVHVKKYVSYLRPDNEAKCGGIRSDVRQSFQAVLASIISLFLIRAKNTKILKMQSEISKKQLLIMQSAVRY
jgi:hypothetical protein